MDIGTPVPANLEAMSIPALHAVMEGYDTERQAIKAKQMIVKPVLDLRHRERSIQLRSSETMTLVAQKSATFAQAKNALQMITDGLVQASAKVKQMYEDIVRRGE